MLDMRDLRIDEEADRRREGRALRGLRQALDAERPADPDLPLQNPSWRVRASPTSWLAPPVSTTRRPACAAKPAFLRRSRTSSRISSTRGLMMRTSCDFGRWFGTSRSSSSTCGTAIMSRSSELDRDRRAVERLQALGGGDPGREPARDVHRDVVAADRDRVGVDEVAVGEDADARRAAAHIDDGAAHLGLVVDERRKAGGVRRRDHRLDAEMAALDREHEVARRGSLGGDDVEIDAEALADHAAGSTMLALRVEREAGRQRVQDGAAGTQVVAARGVEDAVHVGRRRPAAADADRAPRNAREPSRPPVRLTITDWISTFAIRSAAWTAWRIAPSAASRSTTAPPFSPSERWWPMPRMRARWVRPRSVSRFSDRLQLGDEADDLARADVEHGKGRALARRQRLQAWRQAVDAERLTSRPPCRASASS